MSALENDLLCNYNKCRKRLVSSAWVTSCSHVFCEEDGHREFQKAFICPACKTSLPGKCDIVRHELDPSEESKAMMLAGFKPEAVSEICQRSMAFWRYQAYYEEAYQKHRTEKMKESHSKLELKYEELVKNLQTEFKSSKSRIEEKRNALHELREKYQEIFEKAQERSRRGQKLQVACDRMKCQMTQPVPDEQQQQVARAKQMNRSSDEQRLADEPPLGTQFLFQPNVQEQLDNQPTRDMDFRSSQSIRCSQNDQVPSKPDFELRIDSAEERAASRATKLIFNLADPSVHQQR